MANVTIVYTAKRRLKSGVASGDLIQLDLKVTDFVRSTQERKEEVETLGGVVVTNLLNFYDRYDASTGVVHESMTADLDQFGYSVLAGEIFTITNPDEADRLMEVKIVGRLRRNRAGKKPLNRFRYSFTIREIV